MWIANRKVKTGQGEKVSFSRLLRHAESRQVNSTLPLDPEGPPPAGGIDVDVISYNMNFISVCYDKIHFFV